MHSAGPPRSPRHLARRRLWSFAGLLLAGIASGAAQAGQASSDFNVSVNYVAPGSGSCGLLAGPVGFGSVACASRAGAAPVWFSGQALQDTNRGTNDAQLPGSFRAPGQDTNQGTNDAQLPGSFRAPGQDTNRRTNNAQLPGSFRAPGTTNDFSPPLSTSTQSVAVDGKNYLEMTLVW